MQASCLENMGSWILGIIRERHLSDKEKPMKININDVVLIKGGKMNLREWKIGIIEKIFMGKDNTIRSIKIHTGNSAAVFNGVTLWFKINNSNTQNDKTLKVNAEEFQLKISAAEVAERRNRDIADNENQWKIFDLCHQIEGEQCWNLNFTCNLMN